MKPFISLLLLSFSAHIMAMPQFMVAEPVPNSHYETNSQALCNTAKETLAYIDKGEAFDPVVIHEGKVFKIPLARIKNTLVFICEHADQLQNPDFINKHFEFYRWYPDIVKAKAVKNKILTDNLPKDKILMTKYYVHRAQVSHKRTAEYPYALHARPLDEAHLSLTEAEAKPNLTRFQYGKQEILNGALANKPVPVLAYLKRNDLEEALMQGTLIADFALNNQDTKIFNVDRNNHVAYDKSKNPYQQNRYWYFKQVQGIKGYGKDAEHKISVYPQATFAADLEQLGLGKLLMVQYRAKNGQVISRIGVLADTGGAFKDNLYQVDYLIGSYEGKKAFNQASRAYPDYVQAYFMVLKN